MTTLVKWIIGGAIVLVLLLVVGKCGDEDDAVANAVAVARQHIKDSLVAVYEPKIEAMRESVTVRVDTVRRYSTRWDTVSRTEIDTVFAEDSSGATVPAVPLPQYQAVVAAGDSLKRSCDLLALTCERLRDSVPVLQRLYRDAMDARDSVIANPKPFRRWSLCGSAGYGATLGGGSVSTGPTVNVGICWRIL